MSVGLRRYSPIVLFGLPLATFAAILVVGFALVYSRDENWKYENLRQLREVGDVQGVIVERQLNRSMVSAYLLGHFISERQGNTDGFEAYADKLIAEVGGITNLQLSRNGIIRHIHPVEGHEKALGYDYFAIPERRKEAEIAIKTRSLAVIGPLKLIQGGVGLLGRYPVFVDQGKGEIFWGMSSALVMLDQFIASTELPSLGQQGYQYQLWHLDPHDGRKDIFAGAKSLEPPISTSIINLANKQWFLDLAYSHPQAHAKNYWLDMFLTFLIGISISLVVYLYLKLPDRLRRQVLEKTRELENIAFYDTLTGLPNRKLFADRLDQSIRHHARVRNAFALIFIDLDGFKRVNDTLGHHVGDSLIGEVASRLKASVRQSDTVARLGGDEFTLIISDIQNINKNNQISHLVQMAHKILKTLCEPMLLDQHTITITASAGITLFPDDGATPDKLLRNADLAMYKAKQDGKNSFHFFSESLNQEATRRMELEQEIYLGLQQQQFHVEYQPIIDLGCDRVVAVEALLRWNHPVKGAISPAEFIPVAEESGLIIELGERVLKDGAAAIARLNQGRADSPVQLHVNLSPYQFRHPHLSRLMVDTLAATGLAPEKLTIEITESALMGDIDNARLTLNSLRELGISVSIDDFGTGYSSLSVLKQLPVDTLKIDRIFIRDLETDSNDMEIVSAVILMAQRMNLKVIAEGVETSSQLEFLKANNCDMVQGFAFSQALPETALAAFIGHFGIMAESA